MEDGFTHRFNRNGTIDSICRQCFRTVGSATMQSDLESLEEMHRCLSEHEARFIQDAAEVREMTKSRAYGRGA